MFCYKIPKFPAKKYRMFCSLYHESVCAVKSEVMSDVSLCITKNKFVAA
jgi:hypothetical protein